MVSSLPDSRLPRVQPRKQEPCVNNVSKGRTRRSFLIRAIAQLTRQRSSNRLHFDLLDHPENDDDDILRQRKKREKYIKNS